MRRMTNEQLYFKLILLIEEKIMNAIDTLNANVASLAEAVSAVEAEVHALEATTGVPEVQVQAAADAVAVQTAALEALLPAPAPAPVA